MTRKINTDGLRKLKQLEGYVAHPYDDADPSTPKKEVKDLSKVRGTLTWGYGTTKNIVLGKRITEKRATELLIEDLVAYEKAVDESVKVPLNDNQFAALVIFCYNIGIGGFKSSTLLKELNAGKYESVPHQLMKWTKTTISGKKVVSQGLVNRRAAEAGLWAAGSFTASASVPAEPVKKPIVTKESVSTAVMAVGGSGLASATVFDGAGPIQYALAAVIVISFAAAVYWFLKKRV